MELFFAGTVSYLLSNFISSTLCKYFKITKGSTIVSVSSAVAMLALPIILGLGLTLGLLSKG
mgnify:FL=1